MPLTGYRIVHVDAYSYRRKFTIKDKPDKAKKTKKKAKKAPSKKRRGPKKAGKQFVPFSVGHHRRLYAQYAGVVLTL